MISCLDNKQGHSIKVDLSIKVDRIDIKVDRIDRSLSSTSKEFGLAVLMSWNCSFNSLRPTIHGLPYLKHVN